MKRVCKRTLGTLGLLLLGVVLSAGAVCAQTVKDLAGTWTLVSNVNEQDGKKTDAFGPHPTGSLIVDAELARTKITDAGLKTLATFFNLRAVDLAHTPVTSAGVPILARLSRLESLNLTATAVDDAGVAALRRKQTLKRLYLFETKCTSLF